MWYETTGDYRHAYPQVPAAKAPHIGHSQHLCNMAERGDVTLNQIKDLVKNAKYVCKICGRAAAREENLCEPVPL